jgi:hypothetical protein
MIPSAEEAVTATDRYWQRLVQMRLYESAVATLFFSSTYAYMPLFLWSACRRLCSGRMCLYTCVRPYCG